MHVRVTGLASSKITSVGLKLLVRPLVLPPTASVNHADLSCARGREQKRRDVRMTFGSLHSKEKAKANFLSYHS